MNLFPHIKNVLANPPPDAQFDKFLGDVRESLASSNKQFISFSVLLITALVTYHLIVYEGAFVASLPVPSLPTPAIPPTKQKDEAKAPQDKVDTNERGTEKTPLVIKILPPTKDKEPTSNIAAEHKSHTADWWWDHSPELLLALFTLGLWCATYQLVRESKETSRRQLRAYVAVSGAKIVTNLPSYKGEFVFIEAKNFGQTPATAIRFWVNMEVHELPLKTLLTKDPSTIEMRFGVIAPSHPFEFRSKITLLITDVASPRDALYVYGEFRYTDAFKQNRVTPFRYMQRGREDWASQGELEMCEDGNDPT